MKIGMMYAMDMEIESLLKNENAHLLEKVAAASFYQVRENVIACAGGVGKVNAAMSAQLLITRYQPDVVVNVGVAGCFENVPIGTLVLPTGFVQHDSDTTALGDPVGLVSTVNLVEFPTAYRQQAQAAMDKTGLSYRTGLVATGDWFATDTPRSHWIYETFHPLLCEMEGGSVAQVCHRNGVPFLALKSVSDCVLEHHDFYFNFPEAIRELNGVAMQWIENLEV